MEVTILNAEFEPVAIVDIYTSIIWTKRYYKPGDFELYIPANTDILPYLKQDYYVRRDDDETIMIIEKIEIQTDVENGDYFIISGRSLESILSRRIVWEQTMLNGNVVDQVYKVLEKNIGSSAFDIRKVENFMCATPKLSVDDTINMQVTGDDLESLLTEICTQYGIGWKITLDESNNLVFSMYKGVISEAYFSPEFDNLITSDYSSDKTNYKNVAKILGEGEGTGRTSVVIGNATGLNRRELYVDARDISSNDGEITSDNYYPLLVARGNEKLQEQVFVTSLEGEVEPTMTFEYRKDYNLGDIVTTENQYGLKATPRITEIIENWDDSGYKIVPTFEEWEV